MRKFKLINESGEELDLSAGSDPFFNEPTGLGFTTTYTFGSGANAFFTTTSSKAAQNTVAGALVFFKNPYTKYRNFVAFVTKAKELKLGYSPLSQWYFSTAVVKKLSKGELDNKYGILECDVEFSLLSPWAKQTPVPKTIQPESQPLVYPHAYAYTYGSQSSEASVEFTLGGDMNGAYTLDATGSLESPVISVYNYDDGWQLKGRVDLTGITIASSETLQISTRPESSFVQKVNTDGDATDLTGSVDLDYSVFGRPCVGKNKIVIEAESGVTSATLQIYDYFLSV